MTPVSFIEPTDTWGHKICVLEHINHYPQSQNLYKYFWTDLWLVGCFGFNGPLRQYFSLYRAVSLKRGRKRRERIDESKNVQTTPTRTYCKRSKPLPYCYQNCRTPRHWKFTQHLRTTRPSPDRSLKRPYSLSMLSLHKIAIFSKRKVCLHKTDATYSKCKTKLILTGIHRSRMHSSSQSQKLGSTILSDKNKFLPNISFISEMFGPTQCLPMVPCWKTFLKCTASRA